MHLHLALLTSIWILLFTTYALADTEIINFDISPASDVVFFEALQWPVLNVAEPQRNFDVLPAPLGTLLQDVCEDPRTTGPCPHELWVTLDLDSSEWTSFSKFTLRLSWPANYPTYFKLDTYGPAQAHHQYTRSEELQRITNSTLKQYARIRLVDTGVRTPPVGHAIMQTVPFTLFLEPLYFGVLPQSVVPTVSFIVAVVLAASYVVAPFVNKKLATVASQAREEIGLTVKKSS